MSVCRYFILPLLRLSYMLLVFTLYWGKTSVACSRRSGTLLSERLEQAKTAVMKELTRRHIIKEIKYK